MKNKLLYILIFLSNSLLFAQENLVKNGNFKETEGNYLATLQRLDIEFGSPKYWKNLGLGINIAWNTDSSKVIDVLNWTTEASKLIMKETQPSEVIVRTLTTIQIKKNPYSRTYLVGSLKKKLIKGKKYKVKIKLFISSEGVCYGLSHFGFRLKKEEPNYSYIMPREDSLAIQFAINDKKIGWTELDTTIEAKGGEQYIMLGCFLAEKDLHLYRYYPKKYYYIKNNSFKGLKKIKVKKKCLGDLGVPIWLSQVVVEAVDRELVAVTRIDSVVSQDRIARLVVTKDKEKQRHTLFFSSGSDKVRESEMGVIWSYIVEEDKSQNNFYFELEGYADSKGEAASNQKLSEKRVVAVQKWLEKKGIKRNQIKISYFGEVNEKGEDLSGNRRVDIVLRYLK